MPFFVARQVMCRGRAGRHRPGLHQHAGFQISQRSRLLRGRGRPRDHAEAPDHQHPRRAARGRRPLPPAARHHRRRQPLRRRQPAQARHHVSLVLAMIEDRAISEDLAVAKPVATLHAVSHDPTLQSLDRAARRHARMTAVQLLWVYHEHADRYLQSRYAGELDPDTAEVMRRWADRPHPARARPDGVRSRGGLGGQAASCCRATATATASSGPTTGCGPSTSSGPTCDRRRGCSTGCSASAGSSSWSATRRSRARWSRPPEDTRAYFRGRCLEKYPSEIAAASWDSVIFDVPGHASLQRVPMLEPLRGTRATVGRAAGPQPRRHHAVA